MRVWARRAALSSLQGGHGRKRRGKPHHAWIPISYRRTLRTILHKRVTAVPQHCWRVVTFHPRGWQQLHSLLEVSLDFRTDQLWRFTKKKLCITSATHWYQYEESLAQFFSHCFRYLWKVELRSVPSCAAQIPNKGTCFFFIAFFPLMHAALPAHMLSSLHGKPIPQKTIALRGVVRQFLDPSTSKHYCQQQQEGARGKRMSATTWYFSSFCARPLSQCSINSLSAC